MPFTIITSRKDYFTWYVGEPKPKFPGIHPADTIISFFQAKGPELEQIKIRFKNLPMVFPAIPSADHICTWRGDWAQFIYDNL